LSFVPTSGNQILVDAPKDNAAAPKTVLPGTSLVTWLVGKFTPWERHRDDGYKARWGEYWRLWRGQWAAEDRNRASERSRLIAPALAQAVEMTTAEIEEGLFSKDVWFDVTDDIRDEEKVDALIARDNLREDLAKVNAPSVIGEAVLNGALFGTGIVKMNVEVVREVTPSRDTLTKALKAQGEDTVRVSWESIRPDEFVPDPAGRSVGEMLGMFHKVKKPLHVVLEKIEQGVYNASAKQWLIGSKWQGGSDVDIDSTDPQSMLAPDEGDEVEILEYHGKVPVSMLHGASTDRISRDVEGNVRVTSVTSVDDILAEDDGSMVEAIVTIANQSVLLRAMVNPFTMGDRAIIAFQFEKVPGRFWGRGVGEKGYNPQKALDSEIRARIDALAFISSPMIAVDGGRIPRGFKMEIKPGKVWMTQGPPSDILAPVQIGAVEPNTFNQASEMERMVQMGTGAFDTASSLKGQDANGPQQASLIMGAFVKRAKRAIRNVNDNLMQPLLKQTMWRYMQFAPRRYPQDFDFRVMATLGIVAREVEAMQLTQLMGMLPDQYPQVSAAVAKGIIDLGALHNKADIMEAIDAATAPPPPEAQKRQKDLEDMQFLAVSAEAEGKVLDNRVKIATVKKLLADAQKSMADSGTDQNEMMVELARLKVELEELDVARETNRFELLKAQLAFRTAQEQAKKPAATSSK
jgi:hypothetical protein